MFEESAAAILRPVRLPSPAKVTTTVDLLSFRVFLRETFTARCLHLASRGVLLRPPRRTLMSWKVAGLAYASVAVGLLLSVSVVRGDASKPSANSGRGQSARLTAVLDSRTDTLKTLEAARASAEADLRQAVRRRPIDEALVRSLTAEIVNFSHQLVDDEERMRSEVDLLLQP